MLGLLGMFLLALTPIFWLVIALCGLHMEAYKASLGALLVAIGAALLGWHMTPVNIATAALEGFAMAVWPIVIVIIAAVFTYNLTVHTGAMDSIKRMLCGVSADRRVLTLLIGWCFGAFLEGMAGFGIPTTTLASITGIDPVQLATTQAVQVFPFVVACPILMVMLVGGGPKALKGALPVTLVAGLSFAIPELVAAMFIGPALADVVAAVFSLVLTFAFALSREDAEVPAEHRLDVAQADGTDSETATQKLRAWSPFVLIFVVLLLTSKLVPAINEPLSAIKSTVNIYAGDPEATLTFTWVNTPGVLIMLCGIVGGIIQRCPAREMARVFRDTCVQMSKTIVTMLGVLAVAKIMG